MKSHRTPRKKKPRTMEMFGENVFSLSVMKTYLSESAYKSLRSTIVQGKTLDRGIADQAAEAMKTWAVEKGATHFTHWFQPLTGTTAEKHDSFVTPDREGGAVYLFSGKELIQGEPDASSFPSGGLRATFEARGYTAWDPTSPAFIKESEGGSTLCIPTVFCAYHGESLDKKTPLLRSIAALSTQVCRLGKLFGIKSAGKRACAQLGVEQEYFLIDMEFYLERLDLLQTGRTLFGRTPAKHQQMEDHYFGAIKPRIQAFMCDLDRELWRLGVPSKTRHNEVCPAQFEIAATYEELNLSVDHNMVVMDMLRTVAERHGLVCLLHEKPFAGVNGSGKHNNWSVTGPDGKNWLAPGNNPHDNAKFLTMICALVKAVDSRAALLRAAVASTGNDLRLGANEAPPAIISVFLGDQLTDVIEQIEKGGATSSKQGGTIAIGVSSLPSFPKDATDRNRTSPFAFTGEKFEFRAVGAGQSCAGANIVLNTIVAEALDEICTSLETAVAKKKNFNESLQSVLREIVRKHRRILFNGDNYTDDWRQEAERRGLPSVAGTPEALKALLAPETVALFGKYEVLSERELQSRYEVYTHAYTATVDIEAACAVTIARTMIAPAALRYQRDLGETLALTDNANRRDVSEVGALLDSVASRTSALLAGTRQLDETRCNGGGTSALLSSMAALRAVADELEGLIPDDLWPLPSYADMMFLL